MHTLPLLLPSLKIKSTRNLRRESARSAGCSGNDRVSLPAVRSANLVCRIGGALNIGGYVRLQ